MQTKILSLLNSLKLRLKDFPNPTYESETLLAHDLGLTRLDLIKNPDQMVESDSVEPLVLRRLTGEPLDYILGYSEFCGKNFMVTPDVLIPRPETEELISLAQKILPRGRVLDMGTGSGAIAISLSLANSAYELEACDVSLEALALAKKNAENLGAKVNFFQSDLWQNVAETYDLVIANLPYVPLGQAQKSVADFEPHLAVFAGVDGLDLYRRFFAERPFDPEFILCEMHFSQAEALAELAGKNYQAEIVSDLAGFDRFVVFRLA